MKVLNYTGLQNLWTNIKNYITVHTPTKTSDLTNDSNFVVSSNLATVATSGDYGDLSNKPSIPTSTSDLINDSNFVDTSNSAVASGITSAKVTDYDTHIVDTDIHVTTADKNRWNNNTYAFRYSSTALVASSTNSNALLDNTDNLKIGDKVIDSSGVLFSITAIDTQNSTFTIGTALIDLAQDSDVVHKSGNETISGEKTFNDLNIIGYGTQYKGSRNAYILPEFSAGYSGLSIATMSFSQTLKIGNFVLDANNKPTLDTSKAYIQIATGENSNVNACVLEPRNSTSSSLGTSSNKWSKIYGTEYYYGNNNVEFSTKFVTTDTAQSITATKSFAVTPYIYNADANANIPNLYLRNQVSEKGNTIDSSTQNIVFTDKNNKRLSQIQINKGNSGETSLNLRVETTDNSNNDINSQINYYITKLGTKNFTANADNDVNLGIPGNKWKNTNTYLLNGLEPSSLSLPSGNASNFIDISSYFANTGTGDTNSYTASANGWIYLRLGDLSGCQATIYDANNNRMWGQSTTGSVEQITIPILKGQTLTTQWATTSSVNVANARFIPCQGNV